MGAGTNRVIRFKKKVRDVLSRGTVIYDDDEKTSRGGACIYNEHVCECERKKRVLLPNVLLHRRRSAIE